MKQGDQTQISRRNFLRLVSLLPLTMFPIETLSKGPIKRSNQDGKLPNILLFVYDALAANHMSLYGYPRNTTPNISKFAKQAIVYHRHYSAANFTTPSVASTLTGVYPWNHRALHVWGSVTKPCVNRNIFNLLNPKYHTMAYTHNALTGLLLYQFRADIQKYIPIKEMGILSDNWAENYFRNDFSHSFWAERIIRNQPSSLFASVIDKFRQYRFSQIMRLNSDILPRGVPINNEKLHFILEDVIDWIQSILLKISTPFFAYIHLYPPHRPYCTRYDFVDKFKDRWKPPKKTHHYFSRGYNQAELLKLRRYYDEYLAYADAEFGRLWDFIQGSGLVDNTYIIFTSDHGEMFERGIWEHLTPTLYDPLIKIPLIISKPGLDQRKDVYSLTSSIDLYPTILKIASIKVPSWSEGSLLPTFGGEQVDKDRNIYAFEAKRSSKWGSIQEGTIALIQGNQKMIHYFGYPGFDEEYEFYNLEEDPEEIKDIYDLRDPNVVRLHEELRYKLKDISPQ